MTIRSRRSQSKRIRERHANHRAQERLGVVLTDDLRVRIVRAIKKRKRWQRRRNKISSGKANSAEFDLPPGEATPCRERMQVREKWMISLDDMPNFYVIYEPRQKVIITILN